MLEGADAMHVNRRHGERHTESNKMSQQHPYKIHMHIYFLMDAFS